MRKFISGIALAVLVVAAATVAVANTSSPAPPTIGAQPASATPYPTITPMSSMQP
jgi:hypothetical protein